MEIINKFIQNYSIEIFFGSSLLALFSLLLVIINYIKTARVLKKYKKLMRGMDNKNLEAMLINHINTVHGIENKMEDLTRSFSDISRQLDNCIQKIGIVRYNPFEQMGSDQSFSIALLNEHNDGIVLTGLFTRSSSSIYAKPINKLESKYPLSDEEKQAIQIAIKKHN